jgi:hypothetical protein
MSVEGSSHLGPDEAVKREQAERLLADVYDVVMFFVSAYADKILPHLLPYFPYTLPADVGGRDIPELGIVHDTIMAWATEALEREGVPQPHRPAGEAVRIYEFKRLNELSRNDVKARAGLESARTSVEEAARQLATISPDDGDGLAEARRVLGEAITELITASARLMRLDAEDQAARVNKSRQERVRQPSPNVVIKAPLRPTRPVAGPANAGVPPTRPTIFEQQRKYFGPKRQLGNPPSRPASNPGPGAPPGALGAGASSDHKRSSAAADPDSELPVRATPGNLKSRRSIVVRASPRADRFKARAPYKGHEGPRVEGPDRRNRGRGPDRGC